MNIDSLSPFGKHLCVSDKERAALTAGIFLAAGLGDIYTRNLAKANHAISQESTDSTVLVAAGLAPFEQAVDGTTEDMPTIGVQTQETPQLVIA